MTSSEDEQKCIYEILEKGSASGSSGQCKNIQAFLGNVLTNNTQIDSDNYRIDPGPLKIELKIRKELTQFEKTYQYYEEQNLCSQGIFADGNSIHPQLPNREQMEDEDDQGQEEEEGDVDQNQEDDDQIQEEEDDEDQDQAEKILFSEIYNVLDKSNIDWTATINYLTPLHYAILCYALYDSNDFRDFYARKVLELITPGCTEYSTKAKHFIVRCLNNFNLNENASDGIPFLINFASQMDTIIPGVFQQIYGNDKITGFRSILQQFLVRPELRMQAPIIYQYLLHSGNFDKVDLFKPVLEYSQSRGQEEEEEPSEEVEKYLNGLQFLPIKDGFQKEFHDSMDNRKTMDFNEPLQRTLMSHNFFISKIEKYLSQRPDEISATTEDASSFKIDVDTLDRYLLFALSPHSDLNGQLHDIAEAEKQFISYISSMKFYYINCNDKNQWSSFCDGFCPNVPTMSVSTAFHKKIEHHELLSKDKLIHIRQYILETGMATAMQSSLEYVMMKLMAGDIDTEESMYEAFYQIQTPEGDPTSLEEKECINALSKMLDIKVGNLYDFYYEVQHCDKNIFQIRRYNCNVMKFEARTSSLGITNFSNEFMKINHDYNQAYRIVRKCVEIIEKDGSNVNIDPDIAEKYFKECNGDSKLILYRAKEAFSYFIWYTL